jgi:hypothetical protein
MARSRRKSSTDRMQQIANALADAGVRQRLAAAISGGNDYADTLHNVYIDYGYPETVTFENAWNMYRRFGIARNIVELPVDVTWMDIPVITGSSQFDAALERLIPRIKLWHRLRGLDMRQRVGRYAGLFMRVRDNLHPDKPIGPLPGEGALIQIIPIYEGQLTVTDTDQDPLSDSYGQPSMYQYQSGGIGSRDERAGASFSIHPSRLIMAAEGADDGGIYGISSLEAPYNSLMDLRKIIGAGGEGYYKNAAQSIVFSLEDASNAVANAPLLEKFNDQYNDFVRNRFTRGMWTPGLKPNVIQASLPDPKEFFSAALNDVAAAAKIPATILVGQQTGRLASTEDAKSFLAGINSRRENFVTEVIQRTLDWLIVNRILPSSEYEIEWTDLLANSDQDRLSLASKMSTVNRDQFLSGGESPFTSREIRETAGFSIEVEPEFADDPELDEETLPPAPEAME